MKLFLVSVFLHGVGLKCQAQTVKFNGAPPSQSQIRAMRKHLIERHFESVHPRPKAAFDGAIPGAELLSNTHKRRAQARLLASQAAHPQGAPPGTFLPGILQRPFLDTGQLPTSVVTGDFNRDGHMDFIMANGVDSDLWFYAGKGDGTFELPHIIPLSKGLTPVGLATASLRGNGILDLVVAEADSVTIGVLFGTGDGTFGYETEYQLPESPESITINDFNHDGKLDIAAVMVTTINPTGKPAYIAELNGDGAGNFSEPTITNNWGFISEVWNVDSGDVNGDGLPDLLVTGPGFENSQIFLNNGDGTFTPGQTVVDNDPDFGFPTVLDGRLADVNEDGCLDAVVADLSSNVWVALGDCKGNFTLLPPLWSGESNAAVRLADVNGDGHLDIITSALPALSDEQLEMAGGNSLSVLLGDGKGNFGTARNYVGVSQAYSIGVADFNGDKFPDFVTANNDTDSATVYINDQTGSFGFPQGVWAGIPGKNVLNTPLYSLSFADLNGDGKVDAFLINRGFGEFYATAFLNDGTGRLSAPIASDMGLTTLHWMGDYRLGNFRDAKHQDMIAIGLDQIDSPPTSPFVFFLPANGDGTFAKGTIVSTAGADGILTTGDFNRDGKLDFVAVNGQGTYTMTMFLGNGDGTFRAQPPIMFSEPPENVIARIWTWDFNRDGKLDVLVFTTANAYATTTSAVWEFDGNGDGTFQPGKQLFTDFQPLVLADVNGDGHPDIARYDDIYPDWPSQTLGTARFTTYLGQADGTFAQASTYAPYQGNPEDLQPIFQYGDPLATSLVGDFNGDGKTDEAAFQRVPPFTFNTYVQFLAGNGDGTFTPTYDVFPFYLLDYPLSAHDLDGDGIADMVEVDNATSELRVYKGGRAPALQLTLEEAVVTGNSGCGWVFPDVASSSDQTVALSSSVAGVMLPSSVTVPAGSTSGKFCYTLAPNFDWRQVFDIRAQLNGDTATAYASDSYTLGFAESVAQPQVSLIYAGQTTPPLTLTLTSSQGYSSTAKLYCENLVPGDRCVFGTNALDVSSSAPATTTVTLVTGSPVPSDYTIGGVQNFTVVADDGNVIHRQTIALTVVGLTIETSVSGISLPLMAGSSVSGGGQIWGIPPFKMSCSGLPAGATCSFSGTPEAFPNSTSFTFNVTAPPGIAVGTYPFSIDVASGPDSVSAATALLVFTYSVQGPDANHDWIEPSTTRYVPVTLQASAQGNTVVISCSLDIAGYCSGTSIPLQQGSTPFNLDIQLPSSAPLGQHQVAATAAYQQYSESFTFPLYVVSFNGSLSSSTLSLTRGGSGSVTASLNASTGFSSPVTLTCGGGYTEVTCSFSPSSVQLTGGTAQSVTITVTAGSTAQLRRPPMFSLTSGMLALASLLPLAYWRRFQRIAAMLLIAVIIAAFTNSCGGSGSGSGGGGGGGGGGGTGGSNTYTLPIQASLGDSQVVNTIGTLTVTVTH